MKKGVLILFLTAILLFPFISSGSIDSEMQKITHYAEEYETGNIDYVQLRVYLSSAREGLNEVLGATEMRAGGLLKQEQIKNVLGEPTEETKWVWSEEDNNEKKLDESVPAWRKIVFDGKKIQIRLEAYPSLFTKKHFKESSFENASNENPEEFKEGDLIYRLNFNVEFKKPDEQLDILGKIDSIKVLAEAFNKDSSSSNAENLAQESVSTEMSFNNYFRQSQGNCEETMNSIFGSENKRQSQDMLLNEIEFYSGDEVEAMIRLEMCDNCEWSWINLDMNMDNRGKFKQPQGEPTQMQDFANLDDEGFKLEIGKLLDSTKSSLENKDYENAITSANKLRMLTQKWNEKSNDVWKILDKEFQLKVDSMTQEERFEFDQSYGWIKQDQEKRIRAKELQKQNYEIRKQFYLSLFDGYEKEESRFTQIEYEKRLVEEFKIGGQEICTNNKDDNENEKIDCGDEQCGGKICGKGIKTLVGNETNETEGIEVNFYCIQNVCQAREETNVTLPVCGNNLCEEGEANSDSECAENSTECNALFEKGTCQSDCVMCPKFNATECSGRLVFSGEDENACPLEPTCIEETILCNATENCEQPLCGVSECIKSNSGDEQGTCQVTQLTQCSERQCEEGENQIINCNSGEKLISAVCENGIWNFIKENHCAEEKIISTKCIKCGDSCISEKDDDAVNCVQSTENFDCIEKNGACIKEEREIVGNECALASDCGRENDVCSNGKCVTLPETIPIESEIQASAEQEQLIFSPEQKPEPEINQESETQAEQISEPIPETEIPNTGQIIFGSFQVLLYNLGITGKQIDEGTGEIQSAPTESNSESENKKEEPQQQDAEQNNAIPPLENVNEQEQENRNQDYMNRENQDGENKNREDRDRQDRDRQEQGERDREENERREQENKNRCTKECARPCVDKCIRDSCGNEMQCNIDDEVKKCESTCSPAEGCIEKCMSGDENWWQEFQQEDMHKQEKGVFQAGGGCRTNQGKTEGYLWFGGWGEPFKEVEPLKQKYYNGNGADWCKQDLENLIKQREEFEKGFNQEFAQWFFEKYLPNSAEDWEQSVGGIYEIYWTNVQNIMETAKRLECAEAGEFPSYNLINFQYESEYGKIEYWEEMKTAKIEDTEKEMNVPTPYMKVWVFPSKEFLKYEMKTAMKNHEFPGPPEEKLERKNQEGPTEQEREMIKQDERFMNQIREVSEKYGGNLGVSIQFKDYEKDEVVFNIYAQVNENEIMKMQPMPLEEMPDKDVTIEIDFEKIYEMVHMQEKEMRGEETQYPPWDEQRNKGGIKQMRNNVKSSFKMNSIISSAKVYPEDAEKDVKSLFKLFMKMSPDEGGKRGGPEGEFEGKKEFNKEEFEKLSKEEQEKIMNEMGGEMPSEKEMQGMENGFGDFGK